MPTRSTATAETPFATPASSSPASLAALDARSRALSAASPRRISFVPHTHWDREWYEPFEVFRARLLEVLDQALTDLEEDPRQRLLLDGQVALVSDYLALLPLERPRIEALVRKGRLEVGPFYTQPDTLLADGETLLRNLLCGIEQARGLGGSLPVAYLPDPFGHAAQLPQLCRLAGLRGAVLWRGVGPERLPHHFRWRGPDGTEVLTAWLAEGYGTLRLLPSATGPFADAVERWLERQAASVGEQSVLMPVGDDHVGLCGWLPEALQVLGERRPDLQVVLTGLDQHFAHLCDRDAVGGPPVAAVHEGELRSGAFAAVLPGVASARTRGKQASERITRKLLRRVEPLWAWAALAAAGEPARPASLRHPLEQLLARIEPLWARAWHLLIENQAHDSAAGCGSDASHEDVLARFRWAEQLVDGLEDRLLSMIARRPSGLRSLGRAVAVELPSEVQVLFHPGPAAPLAFVELEVRGDTAGLVAVGPDGVARPVQRLGAAPGQPQGQPGDGANGAAGATGDAPGGAAGEPLFQGEFQPEELRPFVFGIDPSAPLFGLFVVSIRVDRSSDPQVPCLEVRLGATPAERAVVEASRPEVLEALECSQKLRIVVRHAEERDGGGDQERVLAVVGPAPDAGFLRYALRAAAPVAALAADSPAPVEVDLGSPLPVLRSGSLRVAVQPDGSLLLSDAALDLPPLRAHRLIDEGDRGDLYHFDPVPGDVGLSPRLLRATVLEAGPWRGRVRLEAELELPLGLAADRASRMTERRVCSLRSEVTVHAGEARVEVSTWFDNRVRDHRLRALVDLPFEPTELRAEQAFAVVARPLQPAAHDGAERPSRTAPHRGFVDVTGGRWGCGLLTDGLFEHELLGEPAATADRAPGAPRTLALTLLRAVGWLARGDLQAMTHAPGPVVPTPLGQEAGEHRFDYALVLHAGDWQEAGLPRMARRYLSAAQPLPPAIAAGEPASSEIPCGLSLVDVAPAQVMISACHPTAEGLLVRVCHFGEGEVTVSLRPAFAAPRATLLEDLTRQAEGRTLALRSGVAALPLRPFELATVCFAWPHRGS